MIDSCHQALAAEDPSVQCEILAALDQAVVDENSAVGIRNEFHDDLVRLRDSDNTDVAQRASALLQRLDTRPVEASVAHPSL